MRTTYELPAVVDSWGWAGRLLKGWSVSAVVLAKTGTPFGVSAGSDAPGCGNVDGSRADRPHVVDSSVLGRRIGDPDTSRRLLPASAFAFIQPEELWGSLGRNTFRKGGIANVNAMLARSFNVGGERQLTLRAESINLLNTAQFAEPGQYLANEDFGHITNTLNDGRAFRFLVRLEF